jgi:homoserine kinase
MKSIRLRAPATSANVGPGYDIFALALKEPFDEFEVSLTEKEGVTIQVDNDLNGIPNNPRDNTAGLAALELIGKFGVINGVHIRIIKNICSGGGMGTTGASAGATVFGSE